MRFLTGFGFVLLVVAAALAACFFSPCCAQACDVQVSGCVQAQALAVAQPQVILQHAAPVVQQLAVPVYAAPVAVQAQAFAVQAAPICQAAACQAQVSALAVAQPPVVIQAAGRGRLFGSRSVSRSRSVSVVRTR